MANTIIPAGYRPTMTLYETQDAISFIKRSFQDGLSRALRLKRVTAPLFVEPQSGLNDDLNGFERAVTFDIPCAGTDAQVVHSLAKWKRMALYRYDFHPGKGLYTDMNAIRRDETLDNLHSVYVDQWDWEKVLTRDTRNIDTLRSTVRSIVGCVCDTLDALKARYPHITTELTRDVKFITSQELLDLYPDLSPKEREHAIVRQYKTVFLMQIGGRLSNGEPHDGRAPDYDDWTLNGDILFYFPLLDCAMEISSMGIRVDAEALDRQLSERNCNDRRSLPFHSMLLNNELPLTIGGGIGQSRLCMLLMNKAHIGEVQSSIWDKETIESCEKAGIILL
ncbi:MAG: aspartate--ammonia ligase [Clostridiales bacterium]|nr:aspartate--ammonia ligase [Clostridiales bacterium]